MERSAVKIQAAFRGSVVRRSVALSRLKLPTNLSCSFQPDSYDIETDAIIEGIEQMRLTRGIKEPLYQTST